MSHAFDGIGSHICPGCECINHLPIADVDPNMIGIGRT